MTNETYLYSENENYKAVITPLKVDQFEINIYHWSQEVDDDGKNLWERIGGPFMEFKNDNAQKEAQKQLDLFSGEQEDKNLSEKQKEKIRKELNLESLSFFNPQNYTVNFTNAETEEKNKIKPEIVISTNDIYIIKSKNWFIGFLSEDQHIECWKKSDNIKEIKQTINSILKHS